MTHDELLAKVTAVYDFIAQDLREFDDLDKCVFALRAVVELHKPLEVSEYPKGYFACEECSRWGLKNHFIMLPCPTIQAIEKELK